MLNLFFPPVCNGCYTTLVQSEKVLCAHCRHQLPLACIPKLLNPVVQKVFYGRIPVREAVSLLYFTKEGIVQQLLHNLKYRRQQQIGSFLGHWLGSLMEESDHFSSIDMIIPVPLHPKKLRRRGYNQVVSFAKSLAEHTESEFIQHNLIRIKHGGTQVFRNRFKRFEDNRQFDIVHPEVLENKHILLVDDLVTTGATLEQCATEILKSNNCSLSIATMAIAT